MRSGALRTQVLGDRAASRVQPRALVAHRLVRVVLSVVVALGAGACAEGAPEDVASRDDAMIGGRAEAAFDAAGYLVRDGVASCSAVLVEPDLVLTAGHCVEGHHDIAFGWGEVGAHEAVRSIARAVHPRYVHPPVNGGVAFEGFDVALLRLERPAGVAPAPLGKAPWSGHVRAIGYGATSYVPGYGGALEPRGVGTERRSIEGRIRGESPTELFVRFEPGSSACYGDSGGPLFTDDGSVVAVLSRFTELGRCLPRDRSFMGYVRVDAMSDFFREAHACLGRDDVQACLRDDARGLCAPSRFDVREPAKALDVPAEGERSRTIRLRGREALTLALTPSADVELTADADTDAQLRVDGAEPTTRATVHAGRHDVTLRSCSGKEQTVVLRWRAAKAPAALAR